MNKYRVPIVFLGKDNFIVEADSPEQARDKAQFAFVNGELSVPCGDEWQVIERVGDAVEVNDAADQTKAPRKPRQSNHKKGD